MAGASNDLVTKADLKAALTATETGLRTEMRALGDQLTEAMRDSETRLLRAFYDWAKTYEVRARGTSTAIAIFDERLGILEERVNKIERGK